MDNLHHVQRVHQVHNVEHVWPFPLTCNETWSKNTLLVHKKSLHMQPNFFTEKLWNLPEIFEAHLKIHSKKSTNIQYLSKMKPQLEVTSNLKPQLWVWFDIIKHSSLIPPHPLNYKELSTPTRMILGVLTFYIRSHPAKLTTTQHYFLKNFKNEDKKLRQ